MAKTDTETTTDTEQYCKYCQEHVKNGDPIVIVGSGILDTVNEQVQVDDKVPFVFHPNCWITVAGSEYEFIERPST